MGLREGLTEDDIAGVQRGEAVGSLRPHGAGRGGRTTRALRPVGCDVGGAWRALRQKTADGLRFHGRLLRHRVHGFENLRRRARKGEVTNVAFFPEACRRQLDRELAGTRHCSGELRGFHRSGALQARTAGDLQEDLAQHRPGGAAAQEGQLLHPRDAVGRTGHVGDHRQGRERRRRDDPVLLQHVPPPRKQAVVERLSRRGGVGHLPPVHLQVPRMALLARRRPDLRPAGG